MPSTKIAFCGKGPQFVGQTAKKKTCHAQEANEEWGHNNGGENVVPLIQGILSWKMLARTYKSYNPY